MCGDSKAHFLVGGEKAYRNTKAAGTGAIMRAFMSLSPGTKLGPYEIQGPLGAGGMGEVYRARDTRLERTVAIKVLPAHLSSDLDLKHRLEREARAISSLNHPHICTLYDIGTQEGVDFLVMEYLEGETLADRLRKGALPIEKALNVGIEITDALDKAHHQGIVHRDLKPGNIMLTNSGAKLMDFGLAKPAQAAFMAPASMGTPTLSNRLTAKGAIVGTFQYMSPEQLEGKDADARSDIFALGAVLYEMATGKPAFSGKTPASIVAAILASDPPPITALQPASPPGLDRLIRTALTKNPDERWQNAADVKLHLKWIAEGAPLVQTSGRVRRAERLGWAVVGLLIGSLLGGFSAWRLTQSKQHSSSFLRLSIKLPPEEPFEFGIQGPIALSRDGKFVAYVGQNRDGSQLYLRSLREGQPAAVPGTENALGPFFSPDGQWLAFFSNGKLKKVPVGGGTAVTVTDGDPGQGGSWGQDGTILLSPAPGFGVYKLVAGGRVPQSVTKLGPGEGGHVFPELLPDGKAFLFTIEVSGRPFDEARIAVQSLETGLRKILVEGGTFARYASGYVLYVRSGDLFATPFDARKLDITGPAIPIARRVGISPGDGAAAYAVSQEGTLVYATESSTFWGGTLVWVDRGGKATELPMPHRGYYSPRIAPDGRRISVDLGGANDDVWTYDVERGTLTRLTFVEENLAPILTPDGKRITFSHHDPGGAPNLYWMPSDGSGAKERLTTSDAGQLAQSWSPDGKALVFTENGVSTGRDLWVLPMDDKRIPMPWLRTPFSEWGAAFSPDGRWLAYVSDETGRSEVYVRPYSGTGEKLQISRDGGTEPQWAHNGHELFYRDGEKMMVVSVETGPRFHAGKPRLLFEGPYQASPVNNANYDVAPGDQRFLMVKRQAKPPLTHLELILGWPEETKTHP